MRFAFLASAALAFATAATPASAAYLLQITESGTSVVANGRGSINLSALRYTGSGLGQGVAFASLAYIQVGNSPRADTYSGVSGPASFGRFLTDSFIAADSNMLDGAGVYGAGNLVFVPAGYASGRALESQSTFNNSTFASIGLTPGTYTYNWGTGANADSFTVQIGAPAAAGVPEPAAWATMIGGFGLVGGALRRRRVRARIRFA